MNIYTVQCTIPQQGIAVQAGGGTAKLLVQGLIQVAIMDGSFLAARQCTSRITDLKRIFTADEQTVPLRGICNDIGAQPLVFQFGRNCLPFVIFSLTRCPTC